MQVGHLVWYKLTLCGDDTNLGWLEASACKYWNNYFYISCLRCWLTCTSRAFKAFVCFQFWVLQNQRLENWRREEICILSSLVVPSYVKTHHRMRHNNIVGASTSDTWISHISQNFDHKKKLVIPSTIAFCERAYWKPHAIREPTCELHWNCTLRILWYDRVSLCRIELENMDWGATFELWHDMRNWRIIVWNKTCKKFKLLCVYIFLNNLILIFNFMSRIKIFSTHHLKNSFWYFPSHSNQKKGRKKKLSHEMKVDPSNEGAMPTIGPHTTNITFK